MKTVIQRVTSANVVVDNKKVGGLVRITFE